MSFIDRSYVVNALGEETVSGMAPTDEDFNQYEAQARAVVSSAALAAGYQLGESTDNALVKLATLGQWYFFAGGFRFGLEVPPAIQQAINLLEAIRTGTLPIPGMTPSSSAGVGGVKISSPNDRPQYFSRDELSGW